MREPSSALSKTELRAQFLALRQSVGAQQADAWAATIQEKLCAVLPGTGIIAGYAPMRGEADITRLIHALPCIMHSGAPLIFRAWKPGEALQAGRYHNPEPLPSAPEVMPDVVLVPLLAFDRSGHRLGYGGGFYDRTLAALRAQNPALLAIGIGFSLQEAGALSVEEFDMPLNAVVTEREVIRF